MLYLAIYVLKSNEKNFQKLTKLYEKKNETLKKKL